MGSAFDMISRNRVNMRLKRSSRPRKIKAVKHTAKNKFGDGRMVRQERDSQERKTFLWLIFLLIVFAAALAIVFYLALNLV